MDNLIALDFNIMKLRLGFLELLKDHFNNGFSFRERDIRQVD